MRSAALTMQAMKIKLCGDGWRECGNRMHGERLDSVGN
jgi:hypothetical protein